MHLHVHYDDFRLAEAFTISRGTKTQAEVITDTVEDGAHRGHGECVPYARYGESRGSVKAQIKALPERFDRAALQDLLPAGAARNAVDCALWDLAAKQTGRRVWELAGLPALGRFGRPILLGLSRKRMIGDVLEVPTEGRLIGTLAANVLGLAGGARVLRVHDVAEHVAAVKIFRAMDQNR